MAVPRLKYPLNIMDSQFSNRRVLMKIYKPAEHSATEAEQWARSKLGAIESALSEGNDTDTNSIITALSNSKEQKISGSELFGTIALPLPNQFQDSQGHGWTVETGVLGQIGENIQNYDLGGGLADLAEKTRQASMAMAAGSGVAGKIAGGVGQAASMAGSLAGTALRGTSISKALGNISSATGTRKPLIDPSYFQNYSGSQPRTFSMLFEFSPTNEMEAQEVIGIILNLKKYASPSRVKGSVAILAPYFFDIELSNKTISSMAKFDRCVISEIAVDYGADGGMQQFHNGMPKYMTLQLTFQEADMTTANDFSL